MLPVPGKAPNVFSATRAGRSYPLLTKMLTTWRMPLQPMLFQLIFPLCVGETMLYDPGGLRRLIYQQKRLSRNTS